MGISATKIGHGVNRIVVVLVVLAPLLLGSTPDLWAAFGVAVADALHALWELWTNGVSRVFSLGAFG